MALLPLDDGPPGSHQLLGVLDFEQRKYYVLDSLAPKTYDDPQTMVVLQTIAEIAWPPAIIGGGEKWSPVCTAERAQLALPKMPKQKGGSDDCGHFVLRAFKSLACGDEELSFTQGDMPILRQNHTACLLKGVVGQTVTNPNKDNVDLEAIEAIEGDKKVVIL